MKKDININHRPPHACTVMCTHTHVNTHEHTHTWTHAHTWTLNIYHTGEHALEYTQVNTHRWTDMHTWTHTREQTPCRKDYGSCGRRWFLPCTAVPPPRGPSALSWARLSLCLHWYTTQNMFIPGKSWDDVGNIRFLLSHLPPFRVRMS